MNVKYEQIVKILPREIQNKRQIGSLDWDTVEELRIRMGQPIRAICGVKELVLCGGIIIQASHIKECMEYISNYSLYAYEEELKQGFITIEGGHRVGIAGKVFSENGKVKYQKYISSINIRVAKQIQGCADIVIPYITENGHIHNTLLISPPCCGKTTLLRDMIRQLSRGNAHVKGVNVGVVDERCEIGACFEGNASHNLGPRTDILDACPKTEGIHMLIRSMSPRVIAVDEIGSSGDVKALDCALTAGVSILATVHGYDLKQIKSHPEVSSLIGGNGFTRFVILGSTLGQENTKSVVQSKVKEHLHPDSGGQRNKCIHMIVDENQNVLYEQ